MELAPIDWDDKPGLVESALRYKYLLAALVVAGALLGMVGSLLQPTMYEGQARVLLTAPGSDSGIEPNRYLLDQTELIGSVTVTDKAAKLAGDRITGTELRKRLSTETTLDRDLITIKVLDPTPAGANELAGSVARAYEQVLAAQLKTTANSLLTTQQQLGANIARVNGELTKKPTDPVLRAERDALLGQLGVLTARRQQLAAGDVPNAGGVALREVLPESRDPAQPKTIRNVAAGAILALFAAFGLAWWLSGRSETRVLTSAEVERVLGLPLLARLPVPNRKRGERIRPVMLDDSETVEAEAFRFLRTSFAAAVRQHDARVVMVTSATEQEGKSIVAANLALALARAGVRVALVDLDLRRPVQRRLLKLPESSGFTEVALGRVRLEQALHRLVLVDSESTRRGDSNGQDNGNGRRREVGYVEVLTAGARPKGVGEFVGNQGTEEIFTKLRERADVVLIDAPPMLRVGDALSLVSLVDAVLVVTRLHVVRRNSLGELRRLLETVGANLLGVVVNGAPPADTYTRPYGRATKPTSTVVRGVSGTQSQSGQSQVRKTGQ